MMKKRVGIIGTGFIGKGLVKALENQPDITVSKVLTRSAIDERKDYPGGVSLLTNSVQELLESADIIVECSGDVFHGTEVIDKAIKANLHVITMNAELQVTTGSYFTTRGFITEAEGDQPGSLAALHENVIQMGFKPLVYGNIKGFMNKSPKLEEMNFWAKRNKISLDMVTSFTDGTKVEFEQTLVANGLNVKMLPGGMLCPEVDELNTGAELLAEKAESLGTPISDYVLSPKAPAGVFITGTHNENQKDALRYMKLGEGPFYTIVQPFHLCHLEIIKTIRRVSERNQVLLNNGVTPQYSMAAVAKRKLTPGDRIHKGVGSFEVRGKAIKIADYVNHIPIGLLNHAILTRTVKEGEILQFSDVEIPDNLALKAWKEIKERITHKQLI
ncbi:NAD(P)-dependent oxidoreductase [Bacillus timonensis]|nr:NAD(P)-dependent oxidoreductase [Bacillus timonensis]